MNLNEQFDKEIETFIQVVERFRQIINEAVDNAHSMRQKAYLQSSKHINYKDMGIQYYKEQESYQGLHKIMEHQIKEFQNNISKLELFIKNISWNHESFYNEEVIKQTEQLRELGAFSEIYNQQVIRDSQTDQTNELKKLLIVIHLLLIQILLCYLLEEKTIKLKYMNLKMEKLSKKFKLFLIILMRFVVQYF